MKRVRITNIYKFIRSVIILLGIIMTVTILFSQASFSHTDKDCIEYKTVDVIEGETLWGIATRQQQNNPYYEGKDVRYIIYDIKKINSLENNNLNIGQELKIPVI